MRDVFIIGSKGIPARYGGFETFVDKLTEYEKTKNIQYHVACIGKKKEEIYYQGARCFQVRVPEIGSAKAIVYDLKALRMCIAYICEHNIKNPQIYVLACRIGPFIGYYKKKLKKLGGKLYVNPDGCEWKREKWNWAVRKYWKISERLMIRHADMVVCDSVNIERYIKSEYDSFSPSTVFIPYGAELPEAGSEEKWDLWSKKQGLEGGDYYLIVGRFVPENNFLTILREFHASGTEKKLIIITNPDNKKLFRDIKEIPGIDKDNRICFAGTVYDQELLQQIRRHAFAYLHGHEVGGTNPSLLEALAATRLNLLLNVGFNREVAENGALYWDKESGNLKLLLEKAETLDEQCIDQYSHRAKKRIQEVYNWERIAEQYEFLFCNC